MVKNILVVTVLFFLSAQAAIGQTPAFKIPDLSGNVSDWDSLFTGGQKGQLDSACTIFAYKTNIPLAIITFGIANATKETSDGFIQQVDSLLLQSNNSGARVAIYLSKEFRVLSFKASTAADMHPSKLGDWKAKVQQAFNASVQPYIPLLKQGKYAEAVLATINDLAIGIKKDF